MRILMITLVRVLMRVLIRILIVTPLYMCAIRKNLLWGRRWPDIPGSFRSSLSRRRARSVDIVDDSIRIY